VVGGCVHPDVGEPLQRRGEADGTADVGCAGLEPVGNPVVGGLREVHRQDHVAAPLPRGQLFQDVQAAVQRSDASGPVDLVPADRVEIATDGLHVDVEVGAGLGTVEQHRDTVSMGDLDHLVHRVDGAQGVGHVHASHQPGAFVHQGLECPEVQLASIAHRNDLDHRAGPFGQELPGHDVGVVLHVGEQDLVARADALSEGVRDQVDRLGGAPGEHDLPVVVGAEEPLDATARVFEGDSGPLGQRVHPPVDVGVAPGVVVLDGVEHGAGLLGGGRVVQVHQWVAVNLLVEDGELGADRLHVEGRDRFREVCGASDRDAHSSLPKRARPSHAVTRSSTALRSPGWVTRFTSSPAKARVSRTFAWRVSSPRERR